MFVLQFTLEKKTKPNPVCEFLRGFTLVSKDSDSWLKSQLVLGFNSQFLEHPPKTKTDTDCKSYKTHSLIFFPRAKFLSSSNLWHVRGLRCTWFDSSSPQPQTHTLSSPDKTHHTFLMRLFLQRSIQIFTASGLWTRQIHARVKPSIQPTVTWRAHASPPRQSSRLCPGLWGRGCDRAGCWRWKVTGGSGVRRRAPPISVCTRSVHRGWWPASGTSPSRPEPSPSPGRTGTPGAPGESPTSATAGDDNTEKHRQHTLKHTTNN